MKKSWIVLDTQDGSAELAKKSKRSNIEREYMKNKKTNQRKNKRKLSANDVQSNFCRKNRVRFCDFRFWIDYRFAIFSICDCDWVESQFYFFFLKRTDQKTTRSNLNQDITGTWIKMKLIQLETK